jgi:transcriptional regulator with XRE-family HTH domain
MDKKEIGEIILQRRRALGLTRAQLGKKVFPNLKRPDSAQSKIKRIENGQIPKAHELDVLAKELNMDVEGLIYGMEKGKSDPVTVSEAVLERFPQVRNLVNVLNDLAVLGQYDIIEELLEAIPKIKDSKQQRA